MVLPQGGYDARWQTVDLGNRPRYVGDVDEFVAVVSGQQQARYGPYHDVAVHSALLQACGFQG